MLTLFLQGLTLGLSAAALPGPFQAFLLSEALKHGWRRTLPLALSPLLSDGPIIILISFVLTQLPPIFLQVLKLGGGLFILYLAYGAAVSFLNFTARPQEDAAYAGLFKGAVLNFLNPNPWLFWSLVGAPILVEAWRQSETLGLWFLLSFYGVFILALAGLIILFALAGALGPKVSRTLVGVSALALASFGLYQIVMVITG